MANPCAPLSPTAPRTVSAVLQLSSVNKAYRQGEVSTNVLHDIGFSLQQGEFAALIGPSGSGKSTLLNLIGLIDSPDEGEIRLAGMATAHLDEQELTRLRGQYLGFIFQQHLLIPAFTALENVMMPACIAQGQFTAAMRQRALTLLERVGLSNRAHHLSSRLSGGQQQRVAIARALMMNPLLVLADEPTGNLDSKTADEVFQLMLDINQQDHTTFLLVTHDNRLAQRCSRVLTLMDGRLISDERLPPAGDNQSRQSMQPINSI